MTDKRRLKTAVDKVSEIIDSKPEIGLIFGSGLGSLADEFEGLKRKSFKDIPDFPESTVEGHKGEYVFGKLNGVDVLALSGRIHYYEGHTMGEVCFPMEVMAECGIKKLIVSNAGGGVNENFTPGDIVIIDDHINFMGDNPLIGAADFIDMTDAYSRDLRDIAAAVGADLDIDLKRGVYMANSGPSYETPAEINMARVIGADIVGMSTVPEVIMANKYGIQVLGLSMITNMAAGITGEALSHQEVIETTTMAQEKFKDLVRETVGKI
ncbi:MAG: purine-nucleoside phosphorylase [Elusimicrobia bacterium]|jgi:purine-nucleoside phosphorylase|nr:purine-nucleoside phosphorylase [Elusimicrobiota bacterium]